MRYRVPVYLLGLLALACNHPGGVPGPFVRQPLELPAPPAPDPAAAPLQAEGSLWQGRQSQRFLAFENRATAVGDLVTVLIEESATAQDRAITQVKGESTIGATLDSDISLQNLVAKPVLGVLRLLGMTDQREEDEPRGEITVVEAETNTEHKGNGLTQRNALFRTNVACIVRDVTESGLLWIEGERHLRINNETQIIRLSGYVRPEDIRIDNTVPSSLIASANIHYGGRGVVSEQQTVPWGQRVLRAVLPF